MEKREICNRLATIEGHLRGIRRMIEEDQECLAVLRQTYAVECALHKLEGALAESHLRRCLDAALRQGRDQEVVHEVAELLQLARR